MPVPTANGQQENIPLANGNVLVVRNGEGDDPLAGVEIFVCNENDDSGPETQLPTPQEWSEGRERVIAALDQWFGEMKE